MNWAVQLAYFIRDWWPLIAAFLGLLATGWQGVSKIVGSLRHITTQLERLNDRFLEFEKDRSKITDRIDKQGQIINDLKLAVEKHTDHISKAEKDIERLQREVKR